MMSSGRIADGARVRANPRHVESPVRDEVVLLAIGRGDYYSLNASGIRVWRLLATEQTLDRIVKTLVAEYDAPEDVVRTDVLNLLERLDSYGLIEFVDGA